MINTNRVKQILIETDMLMEGHFLLTSGRHSDKYIQCAKLTQYPKYTEEIMGMLAQQFKDEQIDFVVGPAVGGIILSYEMARQLDVKSVFVEREDGVMALRRGFEIPNGSNVLVVEDVITTGGSVLEVISLMKELNCNIKGVVSLVDRSGGEMDFGTKFLAALTMDVRSYEPSECPLCKEGIALRQMGSRKIS